jgi:hypothetical protein
VTAVPSGCAGPAPMPEPGYADTAERRPVYKTLGKRRRLQSGDHLAWNRSCLWPIIHFTQSRQGQRRGRAVRGTIIPGRPRSGVPAAQRPDRQTGEPVFPYTQFSAVANGPIWGNGLCRSSDTFLNFFCKEHFRGCMPTAGQRIVIQRYSYRYRYRVLMGQGRCRPPLTPAH